jgi:hypothetical protein
MLGLLGLRSRRALAGAAVLLAACTPSYVYVPTEMVNASTEGYPTARYPVPPEAPHGEVYVTSFGIVDVDVAPGTKAPLVNVRLAVANNSGEVWQVDTRQQILDLGPEGRSRAAYVNTDVQGSPMISVPPGIKRVIDFYYSLPAGMQGATSVPHFELVWRLDIPGRPVVQRTPFERMEIQEAAPYPAYVGVGLGWGPFWWYDPLYPSLTFAHPFVLHRHYPVIVGPGYVGPRVYGPRMRGYPVAPGGGWRGAPPGGRVGPPPGAIRGAPPHH